MTNSKPNAPSYSLGLVEQPPKVTKEGTVLLEYRGTVNFNCDLLPPPLSLCKNFSSSTSLYHYCLINKTQYFIATRWLTLQTKQV
jgi:hypothetical protein